ncbi:MAG: NADH:flavin oxidoreductase/NADH oxidase [Myxococcaceae bacterium]|nr:NADH:flavin oxidoreductase/NADH oxidase [Myxococcaceae bacterium]
MPQLFDSFTLRGVSFPNRIGVAPMCQYSATEQGLATDWHVAHLGARAVGGAGLVIVEATAVEARGRISRRDLGLWNDGQLEPLARVVRVIEEAGAVSGIQLAHAGLKAAVEVPWLGGGALRAEAGAWPVVGPSALAFGAGWPLPSELSRHELLQVRHAFASATVRARQAGFRFLELHGAHGYLLHSFLSPLSNLRRDEYGGSFDNRIRFVLETLRDVREHWPADRVLALRVSATDWLDGGWTPEETVELARRLEREGLDLLDCSSGGTSAAAVIPVAPGYQVEFARAVKEGSALAAAAVGLITEPEQADSIVRTGAADLVLLGRELLRNPYWPLHAARTLKQDVRIPPQYARAF